MTNWDKEKAIERLNSMLLGHEVIVYNTNEGNRAITEEDVMKSRSLIIQYVRDMLQQVENEWAGDK